MSALQKLVEQFTPCTTFAYSGDGMAGETCFAFYVDNSTHLARIMFLLGVEAQQMHQGGFNAGATEIKRTINTLRIAKLGRETVAYFPGTKHEALATNFDPAQHVLDVFGDNITLMTAAAVDEVFKQADAEHYPALAMFLSAISPKLSGAVGEALKARGIERDELL